MRRLLAVTLSFGWLALSAADSLSVREPGKVPARIILTWSGDPVRSQSVSWRTDTLVASPQAQIAALTGSPEVEKSAIDVKGTAKPVSSARKR